MILEFIVTISLVAFFGTIIATNLSENGSMGVAEPDCPVIPPGGSAVTVPNPDDCSTFYICDTNGASLAPCLNDTWFNPLVGVIECFLFILNNE